MASQADNARPSAPGTVLRVGRYRVCYRIAQGGMAAVYLARLDSTAGFSKWVALKIILPHIAADDRFMQMFLDEARLAARLDHPNLCTVFDFGQEDDRYYIAMEYLHGETLGNVARKAWSTLGALPLELGVRLVADAARGLHAAHELRSDDGSLAHVVHRDVSPENIFVTYTGNAKVVDFGVARSNEQLHERTATGELKGKLAYMSPEQLHERSVDRRTDVWALGVVLWEATVGRRLFRRQTDAATVFAITRDPITPPSRLVRDYPRELEAIVMRALDRDLTRRYPTAQDLSRALEAWLATTGRSATVDDVGEFMHALLAEQITWRDRFLRQTDAPYRDLMSVWQTGPTRPVAARSGGSVPGLELGMPVPTDVAIPVPQLALEPPPPPARRRDDDDPDATRRATRFSDPDAAEVIPLTRRALTPAPVAAAVSATEDPTRPLRAQTPAPGRQTPAPGRQAPAPGRQTPATTASEPAPPPDLAPLSVQPLPPRRRRWGDVAVIVGLMMLGSVMAHIWYDRPAPRARPRAAAPRAHAPTLTPAPAPAPRAAAPPSAPAPPPAPPASPVLLVAADAAVDATALADDAASARRRRHGRSEDEADAASGAEGRAEPGYLTLRSNLPAEVFVGSRSLGRTPLEAVALAPGVYSLRVESPGQSPREYIATVRAGQGTSLEAAWRDERAMPVAPSPMARGEADASP